MGLEKCPNEVSNKYILHNFFLLSLAPMLEKLGHDHSFYGILLPKCWSGAGEHYLHINILFLLNYLTHLCVEALFSFSGKFKNIVFA